MTAALSPEFRLVCACCRWPRSPERDALIRSLAGEGIDWELVSGVAERHRVDGLVAAALKDAEVATPTETRSQFDAAARRIAHQNLTLAAETLRLTELFAGAGVRFRFVKGATLAMLAYGSLSAKRAMDIDVLIAPEDLMIATDVLETAGFARTHPKEELTAEQFERWASAANETTWRRANAIEVDLHTRLANNPALIPGIGANSRHQEVRLADGRTAPTLATEELFAYLCVHGALHKWTRIKWLADVGALLAGRSEAEIEALHEATLRLGAGHAGGVALVLCAELFGTPVPEALLARLRRRRAVRSLRNIALHEMRRMAEREIGPAVFSNLPGVFAVVLVMPGIRYKAYALRDLLRNPLHVANDRVRGPLSGVLYPLLGGLGKARDKLQLLLSPNKRW